MLQKNSKLVQKHKKDSNFAEKVFLLAWITGKQLLLLTRYGFQYKQMVWYEFGDVQVSDLPKIAQFLELHPSFLLCIGD